VQSRPACTRPQILCIFLRMDQFKEVYTEKCRDFLCEPIAPLVDAIHAAIEKQVVITTIKLNGNSKELFNKRVEYMQVFALSEALHEYQHLTYLDLSYNNLDDAGVATIARLLRFNKSLKQLDLEGNNISPDGAAKITEVLIEEDAAGAGLEVLNMSHNAIGEGGGQAMAEMLEVNQSLRVLDLGNTELGMRSLVALATSLNHHNRSLHYLNVDNPHLQSIQEEASLHFTRMLAVNDTLRCLKFAKHSMRDHGCLTMVSYGMVTNCRLTTLDLRCNALTEEAGAPLARLLTENSILRSTVSAQSSGCIYFSWHQNFASAVRSRVPAKVTLSGTV